MKAGTCSRGSVSIVILLACVVLTGAVQALHYSLREEIDSEYQIVLRRQLQAAAGDVKRRAAVFTDAFDFCTHQRKRLHNALHRTLLNGSVPGQRCFKGLTT